MKQSALPGSWNRVLRQTGLFFIWLFYFYLPLPIAPGHDFLIRVEFAVGDCEPRDKPVLPHTSGGLSV